MNQTVSEPEHWALAAAACLVLGIAVEEVPRVGVPLTALIVLVMLLGWKGFSS